MSCPLLITFLTILSDQAGAAGGAMAGTMATDGHRNSPPTQAEGVITFSSPGPQLGFPSFIVGLTSDTDCSS